MNEVIQEMASELMAKNMDKFNKAQKKYPQLNLDFDHFVEVLPVHVFPTLPKA